MRWSHTVRCDYIYHKTLWALMHLITTDRIWSPYNTQRMMHYSLNKYLNSIKTNTLTCLNLIQIICAETGKETTFIIKYYPERNGLI